MCLLKTYQGDNTTQLYLQSLLDLIAEGQEVAPRGKRIKEIRPVIFQFNPRNRVTFLKGRKINPFFQLAEAIWILNGKSDVGWLTNYNKNMGQFSDDGINFNAPYGERLRFWNKNNYRNFVFNPTDQLLGVYKRLKEDKDTRQAVASIYNPLFDGYGYDGKDVPCNLLLTFKIRNEKLDLAVFNRSNDIHWGTFGANLCQFSTILETMSSWLDVEMGSYYQITDSLHVYLDDYGSKETDKIFNAYGLTAESKQIPHVLQFEFEDEPRIESSLDDFENLFEGYFDNIDFCLSDPQFYEDIRRSESLLNALLNCPDEYFKNTFLAMFVYMAHKYKNTDLVIQGLGAMKDSQWKLSCLYFLYKTYKDLDSYKDLYKHYNEDMKIYIEVE